MKKKVIVLLAFFICIYIITGCTGSAVPENVNNEAASVEQSSQEQEAPADVEEAAQSDPETDVVEIKEKMFITQINDIYLNPDEYKDKKIKLEGFHSVVEMDGETVHGVIRNGPGCCGNDGVAGFEFVWDGEYPKENDWLRVVGTLEIVEEDGIEYMYLKASEVEVLEKRGAEFVAN